MSTALAVAATTEAMRRLLDQWLQDSGVDAELGGGHATASAVPPDTLVVTGAGARLGLNLFLHRVSLNQGWRNIDLPSVDGAGNRVTNPPLAVDLHFVLSAYGATELQPETLLGHGMQALQRHPVLTRAQLRDLLPTRLDAAGLATQVEQLRIVPESINGEEASRLWSSFQAKYRPSFYYCVSVLLIEVSAPTRSALPVLTRGGVLPSGEEAGVAVAPDLLPRFPVLLALLPSAGGSVATAGGTLRVEGDLLAGSRREVRFTDPRREVAASVDAGAGAHPLRITLTVPAGLPVATYDVVVDVEATAGTAPRTTNRLPLTVAPRLTSTFPIVVARDGAGDAVLNLTCTPPVAPDQVVSVILGTREVPAEPRTGTTTSLQFMVSDAPAGGHLTRLRVDGVDSAVVDRSVDPPAFLDLRTVFT
jgi:Pvc16 N-terminal domain